MNSGRATISVMSSRVGTGSAAGRSIASSRTGSARKAVKGGNAADAPCGLSFSSIKVSTKIAPPPTTSVSLVSGCQFFNLLRRFLSNNVL